MWLGVGSNQRNEGKEWEDCQKESSLAWAGLDTSSTGQAGSGSRWCKTETRRWFCRPTSREEVIEKTERATDGPAENRTKKDSTRLGSQIKQKRGSWNGRRGSGVDLIRSRRARSMSQGQQTHCGHPGYT